MAIVASATSIVNLPKQTRKPLAELATSKPDWIHSQSMTSKKEKTIAIVNKNRKILIVSIEKIKIIY